MIESLPLFLKGIVCKGFGRGSKQLGIPTANFADDMIELLPNDLICGSYYGWAQVDSSPVYKMVMSIGWNPFYHNEKRSAETHILHEFENDFYGSELKVIIVGYTRPEKDFSSVDELIAEIKSDIALARSKLEEDCKIRFKSHLFFNHQIKLSKDTDKFKSICCTEDKFEELIKSIPGPA